MSNVVDDFKVLKVNPQTHARVKAAAKKRGMFMLSYVNDLLETALDLAEELERARRD